MPNNILEQVTTFNESNLAYLQNLCCFVNIANKKFERFNESVPKNLGDTVNFDLPARFTTNNSLVASFQSAEQRVESLVVDQAASTAYEVTNQEQIFNLEPMEYMRKFGKSAMAEIGARIESNVAEVASNSTYRFYGDGINDINTYSELAKALEFYRDFGAPTDNTKVVISNLTASDVVNSGLTQFVLDRNERQAMSWELGAFNQAEFYKSNLLKTHTAGTEGQQASTLTVVSTTTNAAGAVTAITFSGTNAAGDADSVKENDKFQFDDDVSGQPDMRFLTFIGHVESNSPVQFRATADAASTGGSQVTVSIDPPLQANAGKDQNINNAIVAGMQCTVLPSHKAGLIYGSDALFLAMPRLPEEVPFPTANQVDQDTGCSIRSYYGSLFGQNSRGFVHDAIWGKTLVPEYSMMIVHPL